jgi:hypothetical protein
VGSVSRALLPILLLTGACSTRLPVAGVDAFYRQDYRKAEEVFKAKAANQEDKDYVLYNLALLSSAMAAGDFDIAEKASMNAQRMMWSDAGSGRGMASLASAEALKIFKGEPFEKSMASIYTGIIFFNRGETDNAGAAFAKALLAIKQKQLSNQEDFALPYALQSYVMLKLEDGDNARISLEKARKAQPGNLYLFPERLRRANALVVVEMGRAPYKTRTGPGASLVKWERAKYPEQAVSVFVDGEDRGRAALAGDLTQQAETKGKTAKDAIQATKGVTRELGAVTTVIAADQYARGNSTAGWVALGAGLFTLMNQSQADVRQWELLPDQIHILPLTLSEGEHTFRLEFYDRSGSRLPQYGQSQYQVRVVKGQDRIYLFRSGAYKRDSNG